MNAEAKPLRVPMPTFSFNEGWEEQEAFQPAPLNFAERRAEEAEVLAKQAEADGAHEVANLYRSKALTWRNEVTVWNETAVRMHGVAASESIDVLLAQAAVGSELAVTTLSGLVNRALEGLLGLASNGRKGAAGALLASLTEATNAFCTLAHRKPEFFTCITRSAFGVPGIVSPFTEKTSDNAELVKVLEVGKSFPLPLPTEASGRGKQMKFTTPANLWLFRLYAHIILAQDAAAKFARLRFEDQQQLVTAHPSSPAWVEDAAALKSLSAENYQQWLDVIWKVVMDATDGKPEEEPILRALQKLPAEHGTPYSDRILKTTPAAFRKKIKESLARALQQMVAQNEKSRQLGKRSAGRAKRSS